jgi:septal ring factor EnvC (AmiA/AmiB activator)
MNGRIILQVYGKMAADSKVDELPRSGKRGELMKLDADIAEQRKKIEELDAKIQECKKKLAPQERRGSRAAPLP